MGMTMTVWEFGVDKFYFHEGTLSEFRITSANVRVSKYGFQVGKSFDCKFAMRASGVPDHYFIDLLDDGGDEAAIIFDIQVTKANKIKSISAYLTN